MNAGGEGGRGKKKIKEKVKQAKDASSGAETLVCTPTPAPICPKAQEQKKQQDLWQTRYIV